MPRCHSLYYKGPVCSRIAFPTVGLHRHTSEGLGLFLDFTRSKGLLCVKLLVSSIAPAIILFFSGRWFFLIIFESFGENKNGKAEHNQKYHPTNCINGGKDVFVSQNV